MTRSSRRSMARWVAASVPGSCRVQGRSGPAFARRCQDVGPGSGFARLLCPQRGRHGALVLTADRCACSGSARWASAHRAGPHHELGRSSAGDPGDHRDELSPHLIAVLEHGDAVNAEALGAAERIAQDSRAATAQLFGKTDLMSAPPAPGEMPSGLDVIGDPLVNRMWTLLHGPCLNRSRLSGRDTVNSISKYRT